MPKRRRNADGTLVVPLSEKQLANLARGQAALAAKASGPADRGEPPATPAKRSSRVEVVEVKTSGGGAKASKRSSTKRGAKASSSRRSSSTARTAASGAKASSSSAKASGPLERAVRWLTDV